MVLDDSNLFKGAFDRPGPKRNPEQRERSSRRLGIVSIVLAIIWLFGLGSLFGFFVAVLARVDAESGKTRRLADIGIGLNILGFCVALALFAR